MNTNRTRKIMFFVVLFTLFAAQLACAGGSQDIGMTGMYLNTTLKARVSACSFSDKTLLTNLANEQTGVWDRTADEWLDTQMGAFPCVAPKNAVAGK